MKTDQKVFRRIEKKYRVTAEQYEKIIPVLEQYMEPDRFRKGTIFSLYFDTPDYMLIRRSIDKPVYKEKLRFRSYGIPYEDTVTFVEIKKKCNKVVYKRRAAMRFSEAIEFMLSGEIPEGYEDQQQIINEIKWFLNSYSNLQPSILITYDRIAFAAKDKSGLRITFDNNILWRDRDFSPVEGVWGNPLINEDEKIMEIKTSGAMPLWLADILSEGKVYPTSFSKVGTAYKQKLLEGGIIYA